MNPRVRSTVHVLALSLLWLSSGGSHAQAVADPSIGSYYFNAALDAHCPSPSPERAAALQKFRLHFVAMARANLLPIVPAEKLQAATEEIDTVERSGPPPQRLAAFEPLFSQLDKKQLADMCAQAPKDMADRMMIERLSADAMKRYQQQAADKK